MSQSEDETEVICPHCDSALGHYSDWLCGLGSYYLVDVCDGCGESFRLDAQLSFEVRKAAPADIAEELSNG